MTVPQSCTDRLHRLADDIIRQKDRLLGIPGASQLFDPMNSSNHYVIVLWNGDENAYPANDGILCFTPVALPCLRALETVVHLLGCGDGEWQIVAIDKAPAISTQLEELICSAYRIVSNS